LPRKNGTGGGQRIFKDKEGLGWRVLVENPPFGNGTKSSSWGYGLEWLSKRTKRKVKKKSGVKERKMKKQINRRSGKEKG